MGLPTTPEWIEAAEARLGISLPPDLRRALLSDNGGSHCTASGEIWWLYPVKDTRDRKHITRTANHIERETGVASGWRGFPQDAVAVGSDGSGDYLILLRGVAGYHIWWHDTATIESANISWEA